MKKSYPLLLAFAIFSTALQAQNFLGMQIKKFGISLSTDEDRVNNLDANYFSGLSKNGLSERILQNEFDSKSIFSMNCENPNIRAELTVLPFAKKQNIQLNLGTSLMLNRIDATDYAIVECIDHNSRNREEFISFESYSHEAAIDASLVAHQKIFFFNVYGGVGTNLGYTFGGDMYVSGGYFENNTDEYEGDDGGEATEFRYVSFEENYAIKKSLHQRAFLQGGVSVLFLQRMEIGWDVRSGIGYRYNKGNTAKFTNLLSSGFSFKWNLK